MHDQSWDMLMTRISELFWGAGQMMLDLLIAILVVVVGWVLAVLVSRLVRTILRIARFNEGVRGMLGQDAPALRHEPAAIAGLVMHWTIMVVAVLLAADVLGLNLTQSVGDRLRDLLPKVMAAILVLGVGVPASMLLGGLAGHLFAGAGLRRSRVRGQVVTVVLTSFTVLLSLEQLGLAAQLIITLGVTAVAALGLGVALAFGLGCRELARDFVVEYLRSLDEERPPRPW